MAIAKGIGGGFPMGACLATAEAAKGMTAGTHGTTFGGNPLAMAVGNAVLDVVLAPGIPAACARARRQLARQQLAGLLAEHPDVFEESARRGADARPEDEGAQHRVRGGARAHRTCWWWARATMSCGCCRRSIIDEAQVREALAALCAAAARHGDLRQGGGGGMNALDQDGNRAQAFPRSRRFRLRHAARADRRGAARARPRAPACRTAPPMPTPRSRAGCWR